MKDWRNIGYLQYGTAVQKEVFALLGELEIMSLIADDHP